MKISQVFNTVLTLILAAAVLAIGFQLHRWLEEKRVLREVIERLSADSRIAEVLVTKTEFDEGSKTILTTIKFLEYDAAGKPLEPKYFTFAGNLIQFQALVIRFEDALVKAGDRLRGKSAYLFVKAFTLSKEHTQVFEITPTEGVPAGYKVPGRRSDFESKLWAEFWSYALDPEARNRAGVKNAQIEAPGSMFVPGSIYTIHIEHDGGIRIDAQPIPEILKGEKL